MAVADIRRQELTRMDEALGRLKEGRYGICVECGAEIAEERLRVAPYAPAASFARPVGKALPRGRRDALSVGRMP